MPKVIYGFRKGKRLDFRNVREQDRPDSPYIFPDSINGENVHLVITWHGFLVYDITVDIALAMAEFMRYVGETGCCGRCLPGKKGSYELYEKLMALRLNPNYEDLASSIELAKKIQKESKCSFAPSSAYIVLAFLEEYPDQLNKNIKSPKLNYAFHRSAPCTAACPANVEIPEFIDELRSKKFSNALSIIRRHMPLAGVCGRVCPHPCETVCLRASVDEPINIMHLKQSAWNYEYLHQKTNPILPEKLDYNGKNCAIIGAGPAGLSAAYYLSLKGYSVDVFDRLTVGGGMVAKGIPNYREPKTHLEHEVNLLRKLGVKFHFNRELGRDITLEYLSSTYNTTLLAIGAWSYHDAYIEGIEDAQGQIAKSGINYLKDVSDGVKPKQGAHVVVIGGGNTAFDSARTALRLGSKVTIVYRRTEVEMPALREEILAAKEEGVEIVILATPNKIIAIDGKLVGVEFLKMKLGSPDASGRRSPEVVPFSNFIINCSYVIPAIGQYPDTTYISDWGIKTTKWGTIEADPIFCQTSSPVFFAAGDCLVGADTVVRAVGTGRWAAKMMDRFMVSNRLYLTPEEYVEKAFNDNKIFQYGEAKEERKHQPRNNVEMTRASDRIKSFEQVEQPFAEDKAREEANRCMRCMRAGMVATFKKQK